jgi:hypothetical protein
VEFTREVTTGMIEPVWAFLNVIAEPEVAGMSVTSPPTPT